jgi:hypothetical protein
MPQDIAADSFGEDFLQIPDQKLGKPQYSEKEDSGCSGLKEEMKDVVESDIYIDNYESLFKK